MRDPSDDSVKTESRDFHHVFASNSDMISSTFLCFVKNFKVDVSGFAEFKENEDIQLIRINSFKLDMPLGNKLIKNPLTEEC